MRVTDMLLATGALYHYCAPLAHTHLSFVPSVYIPVTVAHADGCNVPQPLRNGRIIRAILLTSMSLCISTSHSLLLCVTQTSSLTPSPMTAAISLEALMIYTFVYIMSLPIMITHDDSSSCVCSS